MSPADDVLISVESPLDFDSEGQLVASVLSKKLAAGSTHVLIDVPVGPTAKVRSVDAAAALAARLSRRATSWRCYAESPQRRRIFAGAPWTSPRASSIWCRGRCAVGEWRARRILDSGLAWRKFAAICEAQGGLREPGIAPLTHVVPAARGGICASIDNRRIAQVAKLAGAPRDVTAGVELHVHLGERLKRGAPLYTVHAESRGELEYALSYAVQRTDIVRLDEQ